MRWHNNGVVSALCVGLRDTRWGLNLSDRIAHDVVHTCCTIELFEHFLLRRYERFSHANVGNTSILRRFLPNWNIIPFMKFVLFLPRTQAAWQKASHR